MNKKVLNIILIAITAVIWLFVGRKLLANFSTEAQTTVAYDQIPKREIAAIQKDTFHLETLDRDPFLGKTIKGNSGTNRGSNNTPKSSGNKKQNKVTKEVSWPAIKYYGYVSKSTGKNSLALLKINNTMHQVKKNMLVQEVKVKSVNGDSIQLEFNKTRKYFKKE